MGSIVNIAEQAMPTGVQKFMIIDGQQRMTTLTLLLIAIVFKDSHISLVDDDMIPAVIKERRKNASVDEHGILQEDMLFTSPSYAAMFVIGKSANGLTNWKDEHGKTLKSLESTDVE